MKGDGLKKIAAQYGMKGNGLRKVADRYASKDCSLPCAECDFGEDPKLCSWIEHLETVGEGLD